MFDACNAVSKHYLRLLTDLLFLTQSYLPAIVQEKPKTPLRVFPLGRAHYSRRTCQ